MIDCLLGWLQAAGLESVQAQELWQPPVPSHHLVIVPEALQQPRDGYKGPFPFSPVSCSPPTLSWPFASALGDTFALPPSSLLPVFAKAQSPHGHTPRLCPR